MNTLKKLLLALLAFVIVGLSGAYLYFKDRRYVFSFTETQLREKLAERTPFRRTYLFIFDVTLENPRLSLLEGNNRIRAGMDVKLNGRFTAEINGRLIGEAKDLGGSVDASSSLRFDPESKSFYLTDLQIEKLSVEGIPAKYTDKVQDALRLALSEFYAQHPVYTLKATDTKRAAAKLLLKDVQVKDGVLNVTIGL